MGNKNTKSVADREAEFAAREKALAEKEAKLLALEANLNSPKGNHVTDEERLARYLSLPVAVAGESGDGRSKIDPLSGEMEPVKFAIRGAKSLYYVMARQDHVKGAEGSPNYSRTAYIKSFPAKIPTGQDIVAPYIRKKGIHVMKTFPFFHFEGNFKAALVEIRALQLLFGVSDEDMPDLNEAYLEAHTGAVSK